MKATRRFRDASVRVFAGAILFTLILLVMTPVSALWAAGEPGTGPGGVGAMDGSSALRLWLRADRGTFTDAACVSPAVSGAHIACWADQSGSGNHVVQIDPDYQPRYLSTSAIGFSTDVMSTTGAVQLFSTPSSGLSVIAVFDTGGYTATSVLLNHGASAGGTTDRNLELGYTFISEGDYGLHRGSNNATLAATNRITNNEFVLMSTLVLTNGSTSLNSLRVYTNGTQIALATSGSGWLATGSYATNAVPLNIGARCNGNLGGCGVVDPDAFHEGNIAEMIVFAQTLNTAQRIIVENYLRAKYDLTLAPAAVKYTGNYVKDVVGIGRESDGVHSESRSAGLILSNGTFLHDAGDYIMTGHNVVENSITDGSLPVGVQSRWERIWYFRKTDTGTAGGTVTLKFDFSDGGIEGDSDGLYVLLGRSGTSGRFQVVQTTSYIVDDQVIFPDTTVLKDGWYYTLGEVANQDYFLEDSKYSGSVSYNFEDISSSGTAVTFSGPDQMAGPISLLGGATFNFYDSDYANIYVASNGFLTFLSGQSAGIGTPVEIPTDDAHNGLIAGWWNALSLPTAGTVHYQTLGSSPNRRFILQFTNVPMDVTGAPTSTFQIKLFESSNYIEVHYLHARTATNDNSLIGIENQDGTKGLQYYFADADVSGLAVRYSRPPLLLEHTANDLTPRVGDRITYTLVVRSNLTVATPTAVATETLGNGVVFVPGAVTISPPQSFAPTYQGQSLRLSNFTIGAGQRVTFTIPATVQSAAKIGVRLNNTATLAHSALSRPRVKVVSIVPDNCWVNLNGTIYDEVQAAVDSAASGHTVKIAGYCLDVELRSTLKQVAYVDKTLTLRGGYTTTNWTTANPARVTVLDAQKQGRVVYVVPGTTGIVLENLHLIRGDAAESGSATSQGGGLYMASSALTLNNMYLYENAADQGGGLYAYTSTLTFTGGEVATNTASTAGGGLYLTENELITLRSVALNHNALTAAAGRGAGVYAIESTLVFTDGAQVSSNTGYYYGGGGYVENSTLTLKDTVVDSNTSDRGAGMYVRFGSMIIDGSTFESNESWGRSGYGGGLYSLDCSVLIAASHFISNVSNYRGGGMIIDASQAILHDNDIRYNTSANFGGGIYATNHASITLQNNTVFGNAGAYGGGLYSNTGRAVLVENDFVQNAATTPNQGYGGGIYLYKTVSATVSSNTFMTNTAHYAAGIYVNEDDGALIDHNQIMFNVAQGSGAGLFVRSSKAQVYDNVIMRNSANTNAGGVYLSSDSPQFFSNEVAYNTATNGSGGGLYAVSTNGAVITQNTFLSNTARTGGGVSVSGDDAAWVSDNDITENVAALQGGGLHINGSDATYTFNDIEFNRVTRTDGYGGGIYVTGGHPLVEHNDVSHNVAVGRGGGGYTTNSAVTLRNNTIAWNTAYNTTNSAGGLYLSSSTPLLEANEIVSNTTDGNAGGVYIYNSSGAILRSNTIAWNVAAGQAGGVRVHGGTQQLIENILHNNVANSTTDSGGGIYVYYGSSTLIRRNRITENAAQGQGGGLYLYSAEGVVLDGNLVIANTAQSGGAGIRLYLSHAQLLNNVLADNVTADGYGSGVYIERSNAQFLHTTLARNTGGANTGVYIALGNTTYTARFTNTILISHTVGISVSQGTTAILNATMWGNTLDWIGTGNIVRIAPDVYGDPHFINPNAGDYHIGINSVAVDAGTDSGVFSDMEGDPRPLGHGYDLGADEYGGRCYARLNNDSTLYMSIQEAVNASTSADDVVKVAGVCAGVQSPVAGLTQTVYLNKSLTIQGGYSLTHWTSSNATLYPTTLDAQGKGRVIYVTSGVSVTVRDVAITGGDAALGGGDNFGGGVYVNNAALTLYRTMIFTNTAANGGGVYVYQSNGSKLTQNTIRDNTATLGGGVYWSQSAAQAEANHVFLNMAERGGGLYLNDSDVSLANNVIVDNVATSQGSGVFVQASAPTLVHLTVARNSGGEGSGLHLAGNSAALITNTVLVDHSIGVVVESGSSATLDSTYWGNGDWANGDDWSGAGNISHENDFSADDPAFVAPDNHNYHIGSTSALINLGVLTDILADVDGFARDRSPDLGADEYRTCWVRLNDTSTDYTSVQEAVDASTQDTDVVKIAGYCTGVLARPRNDIVTTGVVSQVVYLAKTLMLQGGYTATDFITPYPLLQPTTLDPLGGGRVVYVTGNVHPMLVGLRLIGGAANGLGGYTAADDDAGGGLYVATGSVTVDGCQIYLNTADVGSGAHVVFGSLLLRNTVVADNQSLQPGGAVHAWDAALHGVHTTLARNADTGVYLENDSTAFMTNTILVSHTVGIAAAPGSSAHLLATLWEGNTTDWDTGNSSIQALSNYWGAPAFVAPDNHDYHITSASAAIDRGVDAGVTLDGDFELRPTGMGYDLGADEFSEAFSVMKVANPPLAFSGENITYTIYITNTGHTDLVMTVMDRLPDHLIPSGVLFWPAELAPGEVWSRQLVGNVELGYFGMVTNTVLVTTTTGITGQDVCLTDVSMNADLEILKAASATSLSSGERLTYTLSYVNEGPSPAAGVRITDIIPTTLENVQITTNPPITAVVGVNYAWNVESLAMGEGGIITLSGVIAAGTPAGSVIANTASIAGTTPDGDLSNNQAGPVNVSVGNIPPVAMDDSVLVFEDTPTVINVLSNDDDANGDVLHVASVGVPTHGQVTLNTTTTVLYTPTLNYNGSDTFTYVVSDGAATDTATVYLTVQSVNDPPVAVNDAYTTTRNIPLSVPAPGVMNNDDDIDSASLVVFKDSDPASGSLNLLTDGSFAFTPEFNFVGVVSFTYHLFDGATTSNIATVVITVSFDNAAPVAQDDWYYALINTPLPVPAPGVLNNDTDEDGDTLTAVRDADPADGILNLVSDGSFVFTPTTDFEDVTTFTYHARDAWANSNVATVHITVTSGNVPPMAQNDSYTVEEDAVLVVAQPGVLDNDMDMNGDALTMILNSDPANGVVTLLADGSFVYTPTQDFNGVDTFTYHVYDGLVDSNVAMVRITVTPVNDSPVFTSVPVRNAVIEEPYTYIITASDPDGDTLIFSAPTLPAWLTMTLIAPTRLNGTPTADNAGDHAVVLEVTDGIAAPVQQSFTITVAETAPTLVYLPLVLQNL